MTWNILMDLSHNEQIQNFPEKMFSEFDLIFHFNRPTDDLVNIENLNKYDLIILGNPRPRGIGTTLFSKLELISLKKYVFAGGNLFLTSGAFGDFGLHHDQGSLRVLYRLTGIQKFYNAILYSPNPNDYRKKKTNIVVSRFPDHPIFKYLTEKDHLFFYRSTFFLLHPEIKDITVLYSPKSSYYHDFSQRKKLKAKAQPILTAMNFGQGKVLTLATSEIMKKQPDFGIEQEGNKKLIKGCLEWLLKD